MRVLVAGGTGVIGRQLLPLLGEVGHDVTVLSRSPREIPGAEVVTADALDALAVRRAVRNAAPDAVVNLLTALPREIRLRRFAKEAEPTNRLRTEGMANLVEAAPDARFISESVAFAYDPGDGSTADEARPLWMHGPRVFRPTVRALASLERRTCEVGGVVLRFGHLYGPGTGFAADGIVVEQTEVGKVPIVGNGNAVFSFLHTHDAATAIVAALDKPVTGALNVVDDNPTHARDWLPELARIIGAPPPKHVPVTLARLAVGGWGVAYMNRLVGADNSWARFTLDWRPRFESWRDGFRAELGSHPKLNPAGW